MNVCDGDCLVRILGMLILFQTTGNDTEHIQYGGSWLLTSTEAIEVVRFLELIFFI